MCTLAGLPHLFELKFEILNNASCKPLKYISRKVGLTALTQTYDFPKLLQQSFSAFNSAVQFVTFATHKQ